MMRAMLRSRSTVQQRARARSESQQCRRVSTRATDFEAYVLDLQSSIKSEAERLEGGSGGEVQFQDDRCEALANLFSRLDSASSRRRRRVASHSLLVHIQVRAQVPNLM
jgi:hypothetical protein